MEWTSLQPHKKDDFVEAAMTMTVPLEADGEGGFGAGVPDGMGSGGRATARPPSLWVHRDATTTAPSTATRSRRPPGPAIQARTAPPELRPTGRQRSPDSAPRTTWSSPCCSQ